LPNNACATVSSTDPTVVKPRDCTFWKKWFALRGWSTDLDAPTTEEGTFDHFQSFPSHLTKETADGMSFGSISNVSHALLKSGSKGTFASMYSKRVFFKKIQQLQILFEHKFFFFREC
jgi:hypothetical protein